MANNKKADSIESAFLNSKFLFKTALIRHGGSVSNRQPCLTLISIGSHAPHTHDACLYFVPSQ